VSPILAEEFVGHAPTPLSHVPSAFLLIDAWQVICHRLNPMESEPHPEPAELQPLPAPRAEPRGFYDRLRDRLLGWAEPKGAATAASAEALLILPDFLRLLSGLALDPDVPARQKSKAAIAILYIISPLDFLPEAIFGPFACLDDVMVAVIVLNNLLNHIEPHVLLRHWKGDGDAIELIQHFVELADELAGSGLLRRIGRFLEP
jgi:uncharacterized membrane protein YkvA (DUF1232 family)